MKLPSAPTAASWLHQGSRVGFEAAFFTNRVDGHRLTGHTTAMEGMSPWSVGYDVALDGAWGTQSVGATLLGPMGTRNLLLIRQPEGAWDVDGQLRPDLDGCVDVDFESSAVTNTLPIHRLAFATGNPVDVPAVFVRAESLRVERLEQSYTLVDRSPESITFQYESSTFDFECELRYDTAGLIVDYPGIARRHS